jgi:hypothetical protein
MNVAPTPRHSPYAPHRYGLALAAVFILALTATAVVLLVRYDVFGGSSGSSVVRGSGIAASQTRSLASFRTVELAGSNKVTIRVGGRQSVVVNADDNLLRHVTTQVRDGRLAIGNTSGSFTTRRPMSVEVSVPSLAALTLSGSGVIAVDGVETARLTLRLSGSGVLRASGTATSLDITVSGSGDGELEEIAALNVHAVVSGSGRILLTATERLDASVPGSGAIVYGGNPAHVTTSISGNGAVTRR